MKKTHFLLPALILLSATTASAQGGVAINAASVPPDSSALFDLSSISKGLLMPRMSTAQRDAITRPATGLFIFNTDCNVVNYNAGTPANPNWATMTASNVLVAGLSIAANPIGAVCAGSSVTFTATPAQNNLSPTYQWKVNGNNVGSNNSVFVDSSLNNGDVVSCVLTSSAQCVTGSPAASNAITMLVNIVPAITGTTPASFCAGSAVTLSASANLGTINWYSDSTGGSSLSSGASFTISGLTSSATYYVDATANGCTTASRTRVTATYYPTPPNEPGSITGPGNISVDSGVVYSISPQPNTVSYIWTTTLLNLISGQATDSILTTWDGFAGQAGMVSVAASNPCGTSAVQTVAVTVGQMFSYTGGQQSFTVPAGASSVTIAAYGAQGASNIGNNGGLGALATGSLAVTPGEILYVYVGGQNQFNGGGTGSGGCTGGDMSDVRVGGNAIANWAIVAGGGGGGGNNGGGYINAATGTGGGGQACANGAGGGGGSGSGTSYGSPGLPGTCGGGGGGGTNDGGWSGGGGGGGLASGGQGGTNGYGNNGGAGSQGQGGGYGSSTNCGCGGTAAGGGGGGYYGGGGGTTGCCAGGSGGGGSSWASPSMINTGFTGGIQSGNGVVFISWE